MRAQRDVARDETVAMLTLNGQTMDETGAQFGISRERVRQLLVRQGVTERRGHRADIDPLAIMRELRKPETTSYTAIAATLGLYSSQVTHTLHALGVGAAAKRLFRWRRDRAILARFVALAHRLGHTPTAMDLMAHAGDVATQMYFQKRFGGLMNAARRAGLTPNQTGHRITKYSRRPKKARP
jgi:hypothetical protein